MLRHRRCGVGGIEGRPSPHRARPPGGYPATVSTAEITDFWSNVRRQAPDLPAAVPEAWAFGASPAHADELLALVLAGTKTATASSLGDYEQDAEPLPAAGDLSIILDGAGRPRAVLEVTSIQIVPFDLVGDDHARAEGEDDRTLRSWRRIHELFWREHSARGFAPDMPVVCENFRVVFPAVHRNS